MDEKKEEISSLSRREFVGAGIVAAGGMAALGSSLAATPAAADTKKTAVRRSTFLPCSFCSSA
jgi:hypothetical protein